MIYTFYKKAVTGRFRTRLFDVALISHYIEISSWLRKVPTNDFCLFDILFLTLRLIYFFLYLMLQVTTLKNLVLSQVDQARNMSIGIVV